MTSLLHGYLERAADRTPDGIAVVDGDRVLTYAELDGHANRIARLLVELGVGRGDLVGVYLKKSADAVVVLYGVMKAAAAYVPLDPKAPPARLAKVADDAGFAVLLTSRSLSAKVPAILGERAVPTTVVVVDERGADSTASPIGPVLGAADVDRQRSESPGLDVAASDLAYVLYTSGSTGMPKGVALSHRNGSAFVDWAVEVLDLGTADRLSSHAPFHFDLSVFDLYASAASGASVHLIPATLSVFPLGLARFIDEQALTVWYSVPTVLSALAERGQIESGHLDSLRAVVFAGEVFPTPALRRLMERLPRPQFWNWYGPTETNVCTSYRVSELPEGDDDIPIGRPIADTEALVVDESGELTQDGDVGELLICGPTVTSGYWRDPERSATAIVPHPARDGAVAYRTGDLVYRDERGDLVFVGRLDHQIKTRGHRVDLGDVESTVRASPDVIEAAVVAVADPEISNKLHAIVVLRSGASVVDVLQHCKQQLPAYMVPADITEVDALPRTSTLKIDRTVLSEMAGTLATSDETVERAEP
jgi:amino acid adenylation domain-containing protein